MTAPERNAASNSGAKIALSGQPLSSQRNAANKSADVPRVGKVNSPALKRASASDLVGTQVLEHQRRHGRALLAADLRDEVEQLSAQTMMPGIVMHLPEQNDLRAQHGAAHGAIGRQARKKAAAIQTTRHQGGADQRVRRQCVRPRPRKGSMDGLGRMAGDRRRHG